MPPVLSNESVVYFGGADVTDFLDEVQIKDGYAEVPYNTLRSKAERFVAGKETSDFDMSGFYDPDEHSPSDVFLDNTVLTGLNRSSALYSVFSGNQQGAAGYGGYIVNAKHAVSLKENELAKIAVTGKPITQIDQLQLLFAMQTVNGSGTSGGLTLTTPLANMPPVAHLHVKERNGSVTIKVQHKNEIDSTWVDLFTWNLTGTGRAQSRVVSTATLKQQVKLIWTFTGATYLTLGVGIGRGTTALRGIPPGMWILPGLYVNNVGRTFGS